MSLYTHKRMIQASDTCRDHVLSVVRMCRLWRVHISTVLEQSDEPYCRPLVVRTSATCQSISKYIECDGVSFSSPILAVHQRRSGKAWWHAGNGWYALVCRHSCKFDQYSSLVLVWCDVFCVPFIYLPWPFHHLDLARRVS